MFSFWVFLLKSPPYTVTSVLKLSAINLVRPFPPVRHLCARLRVRVSFTPVVRIIIGVPTVHLLLKRTNGARYGGELASRTALRRESSGNKGVRGADRKTERETAREREREIGEGGLKSVADSDIYPAARDANSPVSPETGWMGWGDTFIFGLSRSA